MNYQPCNRYIIGFSMLKGNQWKFNKSTIFRTNGLCDTEEFDDIKGVNRIRKSKDTKDQRKKGQNDLQNITQKTEDRVTRTPLNTGGGGGGGVSNSCSTSGNHRDIQRIQLFSFILMI
jgi:hypothetical protein